MVPLLEVQNLKTHFVARSGLFARRKTVIPAVDGVSFKVDEGETLGLVGESGCGKSTLVRTLLFLEQSTSGEIRFADTLLTEKEAMRLRRQAQIIFQDPYTSLPPRKRVKDILADPLLIHGLAAGRSVRERVHELLEDVGLGAETADRFPHELSGGMRQRVGIARALAVSPSLVLADEAVSSLDVSVQAQILNLFKDLQERHGLTYIFVSHNLGVVKYMSHRIAVMYLGKIVELGSADKLYDQPLHPYTEALLSAIPSVHPDGRRRIRLEGEPPDPSNPPPGCKFHPRCPLAQTICEQEAPELKEWLPGHSVACHFALTESGLEKGMSAQEPRKELKA